jgi:hypothetical protein
VRVLEEVSVLDPVLGFGLSGETVEDIVRHRFVVVQMLGRPLSVRLGRFRAQFPAVVVSPVGPRFGRSVQVDRRLGIA